jgi:hypothetical protein
LADLHRLIDGSAPLFSDWVDDVLADLVRTGAARLEDGVVSNA